ncbi:hypothetical protein PPO43_15635 [Saprospira sp. CCB-QB6]|uniref:MbnP family protein n=1 Tax=Saprospira sp. CCB-QB6 TaxID=3023936 RepID=UPI00234A8643|nr:MbnP family protein [Saprospira sp. CCB-QB6]WCL81407.1 hypothetical protein PPO43_15635 [Saprospira sp. CCB-QB6]
MFNLLSKFSLAIAAFALVFSMGSCKKDEETATDTDLSMHLHYKVGTEDFAYDQVYTIDGVAVKFTLAQFYISGVNIMDDDNNMHSFEDLYILAKPSQMDYALGTIPASFGDHLHMLKFNIGVDSLTNSQTEADFTSRDANDPLAAQNPGMHWSWSSGYIFVKIEGEVDTDGDGTPDTAANWHIGTNNMLREVSLMAHQDMEGEEATIEVEFDLATVLTNTDLANDYSTHTMNNMPLATKVANNMATAFGVE